MKSWWTQFKISNALNERKPLPPEWAESEAARDFAETAMALERGLKAGRPAAAEFAPVHDSVMRAVRAAARGHRAEVEISRGRWVMMSGAMVLVVGLLTAGFLWNRGMATRAEKPLSLADAGSALELGNRLVRGAPDAAMSPLADELASLNRDLGDTGKFLLASLP